MALTPDFFSVTIMPITIAMVMFGLGLSIRTEQILRVLNRPRALFVGLAVQLLLLPALAFIVVNVFQLDPILQLAIIVVALCPGGSSSNVMTHLLGGRAVLSIALTITNTFFVLFSLPFFMNLAGSWFLDQELSVALPFWDTILDLLFSIIAPCGLGITLGHYFRSIISKYEHIIKLCLPVILVSAFLGVMLVDESKLPSFDSMLHIILPLMLFNLLCVLMGWYSTQLLDFKQKTRLTIGVEAGIQNTALAIFIGSSVLGETAVGLVAVFYGSFSFFTTFSYVWLLKRFSK